MLANALDPKKPKTSHYGKEPVVVDQKKIVDHENLIKQGQIINNYVTKSTKIPVKQTRPASQLTCPIDLQTSLSPRGNSQLSLDQTMLSSSKMTTRKLNNLLSNIQITKSRISSAQHCQSNPTIPSKKERPATACLKYKQTNPYYHEYRRQKYKDMAAQNKKVKVNAGHLGIDLPNPLEINHGKSRNFSKVRILLTSA